MTPQSPSRILFGSDFVNFYPKSWRYTGFQTKKARVDERRRVNGFVLQHGTKWIKPLHKEEDINNPSDHTTLLHLDSFMAKLFESIIEGDLRAWVELNMLKANATFVEHITPLSTLLFP